MHRPSLRRLLPAGAAVPAAAVQILSRELFGRDDQPLERVEFELSKLTPHGGER